MITLVVSLLTGCYIDYTIAQEDETVNQGSPALEQPSIFPYASADVPQEAPDSLDTGEYTDSDSNGASESVSTDTDSPPPVEDTDTPEDTGIPPEEDTDEPTLPVDTGAEVDTEPPPPEPPPVEDTDVPVDTGEPPPPPPEPDPGPVWRTVYFEDFEDGAASVSPFNGGCGGQRIEGGSWLQYSDWNGVRFPVPASSGPGLRLTTTTTLGSSTWHAVVRWRSKEDAWNSNDNSGFSFHLVTVELNGLWVGGSLDTYYSVTRGVPVELTVEEYAGAYLVSVDGEVVADGYSSEAPYAGNGLEFHSNGSCGDTLLSIQEVRIEVAD
jgi:hypothetical protein